MKKIFCFFFLLLSFISTNAAEVYGVLEHRSDPSGAMLTIYYDDNKENQNVETTYSWREGSLPDWYGLLYYSPWPMNDYYVKVIQIDESMKNAPLTTTAHMFENMTYVEIILGAENFNTSSIQDMSYMFANMTHLRYVDLSSFEINNSTNTNYLMKGCESLEYLEISSSLLSLNENAFEGVGSISDPCSISSIDDFDIPNSTFNFKSGIFKIASEGAYWTSNLKTGESRSFNVKYDKKINYLKILSEMKLLDGFIDCSWDNYYGYLIQMRTVFEPFYDDEGNPAWQKYGFYYSDNICDISEDDVSMLRFALFDIKFDESIAEYRPTSTAQWFDFNHECWMYFDKETGSGTDGSFNISIDGLNYLNTSQVTDMSYMFMNCGKLTQLDVSHFNTSNVTNMEYMFRDCNSLTSLDVSNFNTSKVTNMSYAFSGLLNVSDLNISNFDTSNVTDMSGMFGHGYRAAASNGFTSLDVSHFNTSKVTNMSNMFNGCGKISSLDLSHFDTSNVTDMSYMFCECGNIISFDLSSFKTSNVTNMSGMFSLSEFFDDFINHDPNYDFSEPKSSNIDLSSFNTSKVTDMSNMFYRHSGLKSLDISNFDTSNVKDFSCMFFGCSKLTSLDLSNFEVGKNSNTGGMLSGCTSLQNLKLSSSMSGIAENACSGVGTQDNPCVLVVPADFDFGMERPTGTFKWKGGYFILDDNIIATLSKDKTTLTFRFNEDESSYNNDKVFSLNLDENDKPEWYGDRATITTVVFNPSFKYARPTATTSWFYNMSNLKEITNIENLNTSEVTKMSYMFFGCKSLEYLDMSHFDTSKVTLMGYMFQGCNNLKYINLGNIDTSANTSFYRMFQDCKSLTYLDLSNIIFRDDATTSYMLNNCTGLKDVIIPASASIFKANSCTNVGTAASPCIIYAPEDFNFGVDTSGEYFQWKKGYFKLGDWPKVNVETIALTNNGKVKLPINISNGNSELNGYQFDIVLPQGISLVKNSDNEYAYTLSNRYSGSMSVAISQLNKTTYRVLVFSISGAVLKDGDGVAISLEIKANENTSVGSYEGRIENVSFSKADGLNMDGDDSTFNITVKKRASGDVNHDGTVNVSDIMATVNYILGSTPPVFFKDDADVNSDGAVNVSDIMAMVNIILSGVPINAPLSYRMNVTDNLYLTASGNSYNICLEANEPYTACEMTMQLPDGCSLQDISLANSSNSHRIMVNEIGGNTYRMVVYAPQGEEMHLNGNALVNLKLAGNMSGSFNFSDIMFTNRLYENIILESVECVPTGINEIATDAEDSPIYNIQGIKTKTAKKGVYIQNGRKIVVK